MPAKALPQNPVFWRSPERPGKAAPRCKRSRRRGFPVIACDKREAFAQGSKATKQSILALWPDGLLRGACHRARIRATRWLAMTADRFQHNNKKPAVICDGRL